MTLNELPPPAPSAPTAPFPADMRPSPHAPSPHKLTSTRACGSALPAAPRDCPQPGVCCSPKPGLSGTWSVLCCSAPQTGSRTPAPATHTTRAPNTWGSPDPAPRARPRLRTTGPAARHAAPRAASGLGRWRVVSGSRGLRAFAARDWPRAETARRPPARRVGLGERAHARAHNGLAL